VCVSGQAQRAGTHGHGAACHGRAPTLPAHRFYQCARRASFHRSYRVCARPPAIILVHARPHTRRSLVRSRSWMDRAACQEGCRLGGGREAAHIVPRACPPVYGCVRWQPNAKSLLRLAQISHLLQKNQKKKKKRKQTKHDNDICGEKSVFIYYNNNTNI
jgi:hypothetical protein